MGVHGDPEAFDQAKVAANKALKIDPSQAQALMALGATSFLHDWNPGESENYFRQSIAARPNYAMAHALFATTLAHRGRFEEAIRQTKVGRHFGLGTANSVDVEVFWPSGLHERFQSLSANQLVTIREGIGRVPNLGWSRS